MIQDRTCRECHQSFKGGPRAYYCPSCRIIRQREANRKSSARERVGLTRKLGSTDTCQRCRKPYKVSAPIQRFCPDCQPIHALEYDRETSLPFYHENKYRTNPVRNIRRQVGTRNCDWCGKEYLKTNASLSCETAECKRQLNLKWQRERYKKIKEKYDS